MSNNEAPVKVGTKILTMFGMPVDDSTYVHSIVPRRGGWIIEIADSAGVNTEEVFNVNECTFATTP